MNNKLEETLLQGIDKDSDNNRVIVGYERNTEEDKALIAKFDTNGNLLWQKR